VTNVAEVVNGQAQGPGVRTVVAVTIGNAVEFYDFMIYSLFAIQIGHALFPPMVGGNNLVASLGGFGIGFLARPVGAFVIGRWSDRVGRKPAMVASMLLIGVANAGLAFIPSFASIGWVATVLALACRLLAGFALGGELGCNSAFLAEASDPARRSLTTSWQNTSQFASLLAASSVAWALTELLSPGDFATFGWRIGVASGLVAIPVALWLRAGLTEPLPPDDSDPVAAPLQPGQRRRLLIGCFIILATATICNYVLGYTSTFAQDSLHLPPALAFQASTASYAIGVLVIILGGWLGDKWGRRPVLLGSALFTAAAAWPSYALILGMPAAGGLLAGTVLLSISQNFNAGGLYATMTEGMPRRWRAAGFGLLYATAIGIFGGATQPLLAWALHRWDDPWLLCWLVAGLGLVQALGAGLVPETRPERR
jgi:MHS family citrate/tricarballylate:H+ symporter-like MFS transporter